MNLKNINRVYMIGIGGIGMSALARYFKSKGLEVAGYDRTATALTDALLEEGINIHFEDNVNLLPENIRDQQIDKEQFLVIYTPAIPAHHSEYVFFNENGFNIMKRSEVLGLLTIQTDTVAVAGTHGKTTISSMIAHILKTADVDCSAFLGGILQNYDSNLILNNKNSEQPVTVVEADEFDRSFLTLFPKYAVMSSVDEDHLDIYGSKEDMHHTYGLFANQVKEGGILLVHQKVKETLDLEKTSFTYSLEGGTDYYTQNVSIDNGEYVYDLAGPEENIEAVKVGLPGLHNVENSVAAAAITQQMGIAAADIKKGLSSFKGVKRRFEYHIKNDALVYIDDYAHHPEEIKACVESVKALYPGKRITGVFQPHLFSRTQDFADGFAESLALLDELILLEIYPAREEPIPGVDAKMLLDKVQLEKKMICAKEDLVQQVVQQQPEVLLTLGAGDIDQLVEPLQKALH